MLLAFAPWLYVLLYQVAPTIVPFQRHVILDRVEIWYGTALRVLDGSWYEILFGRGRDFLRVDGNFFIDGQFTSTMHSHPHNMVLQLWLDMGVVGVLYVAMFLLPLYYTMRDAEEHSKPAIVAAFTMLVLICSVTHFIVAELVTSRYVLCGLTYSSGV